MTSLFPRWAAGGIARVSTGTGGVLAADGSSINPDLSADGRYVVFESTATNWAATPANTTSDIFLKDRVTDTLERLSTSLTGGDGNDSSRFAKISADGRFVVFESAATNLIGTDTNGQTDIYIWDRDFGSLTNLSSLDPVGTRNPNNASNLPDVAYDNGWGGVVVFQTAKALVAADIFNGVDVYAFNLLDDSFQLVSSKADGSAVQLSSGDASVSGDGRFVVFSSVSDELVPGDTNGTRDVFVKDLFTGQIALVSSSAAGVQGNQSSGNPEISLGGEWIVFESSASNLAGTDANGTFNDVFRVANPLLLDTLIGGAGDDIYVLARADIVQEQVNGGIDTIQSSISYSLADTDGAGALGGNVENLTLTGSANLDATGNALNNVLTGNSGNNVLNGDSGSDTASYVSATAGVTVNLTVLTPQNTVGAGTDTLISIENLIGSNLNDVLTGDSGNNVLDGGPGNDSFTGGAGDDTYITDSAADVITSESAGAGGAGIDTVVAGVNWTLQAFLENLVLTGTSNLSGGGNSGNNLIVGNSGNNVLNGFSGDDTLDGGLGNDSMTGGQGDDTYITDSSADVITSESSVSGGAGIDTVRAGVNWTLQAFLENLVLTGTGNLIGGGNSVNNVLTGNSGNNLLNSFSGDDMLSGGIGNDTLNGGDGGDTVAYGDAVLGVIAELWQAFASNDGHGNIDTLLNIENLIGSAFNDILAGDVGNNAFKGGAGSDSVYGGDGIDNMDYSNAGGAVRAELWQSFSSNDGQGGTDLLIGIENLTGSAFNDILAGDNGNNVLRGGAGVDGLYGAGGIDTADYLGATSGVTAELWQAFATNDGQGSTDTLIGIENLSGSNFNDILAGDTGDNQFKGGIGHDSIYGGAGIDTMSYKDATNGVTAELWQSFSINDGQGGTDLLIGIENLTGSNFSDTLAGDAGNNVLKGGAGNDGLYGAGGTDTADYSEATGAVIAELWNSFASNDGQGGADVLIGLENLIGSNFNDILAGDANANRLEGGKGSDTLVGAAGADNFAFGAGSGVDYIYDFSKAQLDKVYLQSNLNGSGITTTAQALAATSTIGGSAVVNLGSGNTVTLVGVTAASLVASDFVIF